MENLSLQDAKLIGEYITYMELARSEGREAARQFLNELPLEDGKAIDSAVCVMGQKLPERWILKTGVR